MVRAIDRIRAYFTEPIFPSSACQLGRIYASGISFSRKEKRILSHFILPLEPGVLEPSFEKKNIMNPGALEASLRTGVRRLRGLDGVSLLVPETCLKVFLLTFNDLPSSPKEREEVLRWRLNKLVPLKAQDMRLAYDVFNSGGQIKVLLALARVDVIREYEALFGRLGLKVPTVTIPVLNLVKLVKLDRSRNAVIVNIEDDYVSLLAILDGEVSLYRMKPFRQEMPGLVETAHKMEQVVTEVENTVHFIEDREKKKIYSAWVRSALRPAASEERTLLRERLPLLEICEFSGPAGLNPLDRQILSPLIGQCPWRMESA
jgi:hypothetical protein